MNLGEFDRKHISPVKGAITAAVHAVVYLAIPYMVLTFVLIMLAGRDGPAIVEDLLREMQALVIVFGILLAVLGFFKGAYPRGSYSRFTFAITASVLVIVYVFSLLLNGRTEEVIAREAFELDLYSIFALYFFPALLAVLMQFGEFADHRRPFLEKEGKVPAMEREDPDGHRFYHDFRPRYGSLFNGLKLARSTLVGFVIIPLVILILLQAGLSSLNVEEVDSMVSNLDDISSYMVLLGVPMSALAFFKGFYPKGSVSRFIPAVAMVLIALYWIWLLGMGGQFVFDSIEEISIELDFSGLLLLIMAGTAIWIVYYVLELLLYRREWREAGFPKDLRSQESRRERKLRKAEAVLAAEKKRTEDAQDAEEAPENSKEEAATPDQESREA